MTDHNSSLIKHEFLLERLIFFSDAVFAIILTIMILDIKLPESALFNSEADSKTALTAIYPKIIAYAVSFWVIGSFWMTHFRIYGYLKTFNKPLLVLNLLFLFSISLFPFALSFALGHSNFMKFKWGVYTYFAISYFCKFTQTTLTGYIIVNREELVHHPDTIDSLLTWKITRLDLFFVPTILFLMACSIYFDLSMKVVYGAMILFALVTGATKRILYPNWKKQHINIFSFFRKNKTVK